MATTPVPTFDRPEPIPVALTYDDVLLVPKRSAVRSRRDVSTKTFLSRRVRLNIPIVASNMDTVCEAAMAVAMAREGGIGILHRFCSVEEQCAMVRKVKRAQSLIVDDPRTIAPTATKAEALLGFAWEGRKGGVRSLMVVDGFRRLLGIVTPSDIQFSSDRVTVSDVMTPRDKLKVLTTTQVSVDDARQLMHQHRTSNIPIVNGENQLVGLITGSDIAKLLNNVHASLDTRSRLLVGAAVGVKSADISRAEALVAAGVDALVIDIAHGHSDFCLDMLKALKANPKTNTVDIIAGNIATAEAARDLIAGGADGLKVGVGPGSICITRLVAGSGVPQLTALLDVCRVARRAGIPVIADGGVRTAGDVSKAMAAGASTVMLGNMLAGTDESPGKVLVKDGKKVKIIRGMAGYGANISKAEREQQLEDDVFLDLVPEGVEGSVAYKGAVGSILKQVVGGLRSGMSYCGVTRIEDMPKGASFVRMTTAGLKESGPHDISKL